jgi:hypothetical protein
MLADGREGVEPITITGAMRVGFFKQFSLHAFAILVKLQLVSSSLFSSLQ